MAVIIVMWNSNNNNNSNMSSNSNIVMKDSNYYYLSWSQVQEVFLYYWNYLWHVSKFKIILNTFRIGPK